MKTVTLKPFLIKFTNIRLKTIYVRQIYYLDDDRLLKGDPVCIVFQNINFYLGGTANIWEKSGSQLGLELVSVDKRKKQVKIKNEESINKKLNSVQQCLNDQKLEVFSYSSGLKVGLEKISTGQADKIHHGKGPYVVEFKNLRNVETII